MLAPFTMSPPQTYFPEEVRKKELYRDKKMEERNERIEKMREQFKERIKKREEESDKYEIERKRWKEESEKWERERKEREEMHRKWLDSLTEDERKELEDKRKKREEKEKEELEKRLELFEEYIREGAVPGQLMKDMEDIFKMPGIIFRIKIKMFLVSYAKEIASNMKNNKNKEETDKLRTKFQSVVTLHNKINKDIFNETNIKYPGYSFGIKIK